MDLLIEKVKSFEDILSKFPEVKYAGDPILRKPTEDVSVERGVEIGERLCGILKRYRDMVGYGRGFAAPQIGENKSVFVTFVSDEFQVFINPRIVKRSKRTNFYRELCLSSGIMSADVERSIWIIMEWLDLGGNFHKEKFDGFLSRLYQHEESHLRGKLNLDECLPGGIDFALSNPLEEKLRDSR